MYRYNKNHLPDPAKSTQIADMDSETESPLSAASGPPNLENEPPRPKPPDQFSNTHERILRSGKNYQNQHVHTAAENSTTN